jgi:hypothetical protein
MSIVSDQPADEATVRAAVAEAVAAHGLPEPVRVRLTESSPEHPYTHLGMRTTAEIMSWAAHLDLRVQVEVYETDDGAVWRHTLAAGYWLGRRLLVGRTEPVGLPLPVTSPLLDRARRGLL